MHIRHSLKIILLIICSQLLFANGTGLAARTSAEISQQTVEDNFVYMPVSFGTDGLFLRILGAETHAPDDTTIGYAQGASMRWFRYGAFQWNQIEPISSDPPVYDWDVVNDTALQKAAERGLTIIATIRFAPTWAQKFPGVECGPIAENSLDAFAQFVEEAVLRYSGSPTYVKHWEFGNEPDIDPSLVPPNSIFGCWGDMNDDYYGGEYYAQMLERVYPAVKAADPDSKVLVGGLLLDCDPANPPPTRDCLPSKFLEGILRYNTNQGKNYFDMLSFHGYPVYYNEEIYDEDWPDDWKHRGGIVSGKVDYIREVLSHPDFDAGDKPLLHTEGGLLCPAWQGNSSCDPPEADFYEAQAEYVVWMYVRDISMDLYSGIWYTIENHDWHNTGLLYSDFSPRPAYYAYQFMSQELAGARYIGLVNDYPQFPEIRAFAFWKWGKRVWVMWAANRLDHLINLPSGVLKVYDKYGSEIIPSGGQITVNSPVYVELSP